LHKLVEVSRSECRNAFVTDTVILGTSKCLRCRSGLLLLMVELSSDISKWYYYFNNRVDLIPFYPHSFFFISMQMLPTAKSVIALFIDPDDF